MEMLAEQPKHEQLKSFDALASIDMLRFDLQRYGQVLPETRRRVRDEELSYLAEGVDRAARTSFTLRREGNDLVYFDEGTWRPYTGMLLTGLDVAVKEAEADPRRTYLADRARTDLQNGYRMRDLQPGQQMAWYSPYPVAEAALYGESFVRDHGFRPDRQMGFLYRAVCDESGNVELQSQTVDRSDNEAFQAALSVVEYDPTADLDVLVRTYDGALAKKYGGRFYAGRRSAELHENAWDEILVQRDLVAYFLDGLELISARDVSREELERAAKQHVYGVWAAFKKRLDKWSPDAPLLPFADRRSIVGYVQLELEVRGAFQEFASAGRVLSGCGGSISASEGTPNIMSASGTDVFSSIFGEKSESSSYSFDKKMYCVVCQAPPKEKESKKMCGPCGICRGCDAKLSRK